MMPICYIYLKSNSVALIQPSASPAQTIALADQACRAGGKNNETPSRYLCLQSEVRSIVIFSIHASSHTLIRPSFTCPSVQSTFSLGQIP